MPEIIGRFRGPYKFLSNFAESPIEFEGRKYDTVEHAYQERKTLDEERRKKIRNADGPMKAANLGRADETEVRDGWVEDDIKAEVMRKLVKEKFKQNPELAEKLIATGDAVLIEGNYWHDNYFGMCTCKECKDIIKPRNELGKILMDVRKQLKNGEIEVDTSE